MELITILIMSIIILITLVIILKLNRKNMKLIKQTGYDKKLNEITNCLPENKKICKEILSILKNENVNIKEDNGNKQASLYIVASNTILIANIKDTFTRVQTIAHECIHSIQDKYLLWSNFIFSNIYLLYYFIITILTLFNKISMPNIHAIILVMMSMLLFFIRSYIETDAMTRARFLAKEYMLGNTDKISKENINVIVENLDKLNSVGIKFYNLTILANYLIKVIIYCVIAMI